MSTNLENIIKQLESGNYETVNNIDGEIFRNILNKNNQELKTLAARTIAELAKRDEYRKKLSSEDIVKELCYMLEVKGEENKRQACRALGNLCCDCDEARTLLSPKISSVLILAADSEPGPLRLCCCRLLLNYMLGGPSFVQCSLQHNALNTLHKLIRHEFESSQENEDCLTAALLALSVILENQPSLVLDNELNLLIVEILKETKNIEISEMCLEHLHAQCEHGD